MKNAKIVQVDQINLSGIVEQYIVFKHPVQ